MARMEQHYRFLLFDAPFDTDMHLNGLAQEYHETNASEDRADYGVRGLPFYFPETLELLNENLLALEGEH